MPSKQKYEIDKLRGENIKTGLLSNKTLSILSNEIIALSKRVITLEQQSTNKLEKQITNLDGNLITIKGRLETIDNKELFIYEASDNELFHDSSSQNTNLHTWIKLKETKLLETSKVLRIKYYAHCSGGGGDHIQSAIYRNGIIVGTPHSLSAGTSNWYTEDIIGWSVGDLLQIYGGYDTANESTTTVNNLYILGTLNNAITDIRTAIQNP